MSEYRILNLKRNPNYYTWIPSRTNDETNGNIEFLQPYSVVAANVLLEIGTAVISAVTPLDEHLSQTHPVSRNIVVSQCIVLFRTSLLGYALLNASWTAPTISMRSNVREWTCVLLANTPRQHSHKFCTTGVSSGLASRVTLPRVSRGRLGKSIIRKWTCFWFHLCTVVRYFFALNFKWYNLYFILFRSLGRWWYYCATDLPVMRSESRFSVQNFPLNLLSKLSKMAQYIRWRNDVISDVGNVKHRLKDHTKSLATLEGS
jgi:hypothetical protein